MGIFKTRRNKRYDYEPRYYKNGGKRPFEMGNRFDEYRTASSPARGLKNKFKHAWADYKGNPSQEVNRRVLIIVAVLIILFLFLIDFDLSIFTTTR